MGNMVAGDFAFLGSGASNDVSGAYASIVAGQFNTASGEYVSKVLLSGCLVRAIADAHCSIVALC